MCWSAGPTVHAQADVELELLPCERYVSLRGVRMMGPLQNMEEERESEACNAAQDGVATAVGPTLDALRSWPYETQIS